MDTTDLLSGWKAIAGYLHVSVSTVQRWARLRGLPVSRGALRRRVYTEAEDLRRWLRAGAR